MNDEPVLSVKNLRREFEKGAVAVADLSFEVRAGEVVGLLGANGAGKTTAMHIILGLMSPTSGTVRAFGMDPFKDRVAILRRCNFASAYTDLPGNLLVWQNLTVFGRIYGVKDLPRRIDEMLELFEIPHLKKRVTGHLYDRRVKNNTIGDTRLPMASWKSSVKCGFPILVKIELSAQGLALPVSLVVSGEDG